MTPTELLAKLDYLFLRRFLTANFPKTAIEFYSKNRPRILEMLEYDQPTPYIPKELERTLWGIKFRSPIMNAAGMFKNGECHDLMAAQGAGAYLAGTTTAKHRDGNTENVIKLPFAPLPRSNSALNCLGLPNYGHDTVALLLKYSLHFSPGAETKNVEGFPIGASLDSKDEPKLEELVNGMIAYKEAGVDFIELNESCPNTQHGKPQDEESRKRLLYVKQNFLDKRKSDNGKIEIPVVVKFSNDTKIEDIPMLMDMLFELGYDGVNFGNTSTDYGGLHQFINKREWRLYQHFTKEFGGGISGRPLKNISLELASKAVEYKKKGAPSHEFHVIRTGGIESADDIKHSNDAEISLNQWFTGYWENFARHGHDVYRELYKQLHSKT